MRENDAQIIGLKGLEFLASDPDKYGGFLGLTGMTTEDIIKVASENSTLIGVLDYLLSNEPLLMEFCSENNVAPELPKTARMVLSGEDFY